MGVVRDIVWPVGADLYTEVYHSAFSLTRPTINRPVLPIFLVHRDFELPRSSMQQCSRQRLLSSNMAVSLLYNEPLTNLVDTKSHNLVECHISEPRMARKPAFLVE